MAQNAPLNCEEEDIMITLVHNKMKLLFITLLALNLTANAASTDSKAELIDNKAGSLNAKYCLDAAKLTTKQNQETLEGLSRCNRAIRFDSLNNNQLAKAYINRGILMKRMQRIKYAQSDYTRARRIIGDNAVLRINEGNLAYIQGDFEKAVELYSKALSMPLTKPYMAYLNRGFAHEKLNNYQAAINDYLEALEDNPRLTSAHNQLMALTVSPELLSGTTHKAHQQEDMTLQSNQVEKPVAGR